MHLANSVQSVAGFARSTYDLRVATFRIPFSRKASELPQDVEPIRPASLRPLGKVIAVTTALAIIVAAGLVVATLWGLGLLHRKQLSASTSAVLDVVKLAFAFVAGVGGSVGLVLAYRRHQLAELAEVREKGKEYREDAKEARERIRLFNERFGSAAAQLGSEQHAVRLAGVYAISALADEWLDGRQTCIDVLCASLRRAYAPEPDSEPAEKWLAWKDNQDFRHTIIRVITAHLREDAATPWNDFKLDFTRAVFDGGDFSHAIFSGNNVTFAEAKFVGGVNFTYTSFQDGSVDFTFVEFDKGWLDFTFAEFSGGVVDLEYAKIKNGGIDFEVVTFDGGRIALDHCELGDAKISFAYSTMENGAIAFDEMEMRGGEISFEVFDLSGGMVSFNDAEIYGGSINLDRAKLTGGVMDLSRAALEIEIDLGVANIVEGVVRLPSRSPSAPTNEPQG